jgi:COMPASS component SWD3
MSLLQHHYKILGLKPGASLEEIKQAYRALAKEWHPDCFMTDPTLKQQAEKRFKQISEAYEVLKNEVPNADSFDGVSRSSGSKTTRNTTNPEDYYESGAAYVKDGLYEAAIADFTVAIRLNPYYGEAYRFRGHVNSLLGFERRAEADLEKAAFLLGELNNTTQEKTAPTSNPQDTVRDSAPEARQTAPAYVHNPGPWHCTQTFSDCLGEVTAIALTREGKILAIGSTDHRIHLYNLRTGKLFCTLAGHTQAVRSVEFSQDGQLLVSASQDCTIEIWHLASGSLLKTLTGHTGGVAAIAAWMVRSDFGKLILGNYSTSVTDRPNPSAPWRLAPMGQRPLQEEMESPSNSIILKRVNYCGHYPCSRMGLRRSRLHRMAGMP